MKKSKLFQLIGSGIAAIALAIAVSTASGTCFYFAHQPDVPEGLAKYQK
jgi:cyclic lactone autoinducer peptide